MNDELKDLASLYVLDQLDAPDRAAFEVRLAREPELATFVLELEAGLASGVRSLPQRPPPADLFEKIEAQIDEGNRRSLGSEASAKEAARSERAGTVGSTWVPFAKWGIAAVIAVSLAILALQSLRRSGASPTIIVVGLDANRNTFAELPLQGGAKDPDARFIELASLARNYLEKPGDLPAATQPTAEGNHGYALFDPASQQGFIAIEQLGTIDASQRYHLWVIDPATGQVRDAGVLPSAVNNRGLYSFALEDGAGAKSARPHFFVTVEDDSVTNPPAKPRGKVVLGSKSF